MTVRVGFLGAGLIATFHSKMLRASGEDVTWAGVHDPDADRAAAFAAASGATVCESEEEVLDTCDAVYVCTWTAEHLRLVAEAARRDLPVFCEKPLSTGLEDARRMVEVVEEAGVLNQVGLVLRRSPAFNLVRSLAADPESGRLMAVAFRDDQYIPTQGTYRSTWRGDPALAGSGTLLEHSIHDLDLLDQLARVTSVSARSAEVHGIAGIEDSVAVSLGFDGGAVGTLVSVWHDVLERPSLRRFEVFCERTWIALEGDWFGPVRWMRLGQAEVCLEGDALLAECDRRRIPLDNPDGAFIRAVRGEEPASPSFADALRAHVLVDAVYRSAAGGGSAIEVP